MSKTPLEMWNGRYQSEDFLFGRVSNAFLKSQADLFKPGQRVLAVADGDGRNSCFMASLGADVTALDFSPVALEKSKLLAAEMGVSVTHGLQDMYDWQVEPGTWDMVVAIFIQFAPPDKRGPIFANLAAALKPGGLLIMQGYRPEQIEYKTGGPPQAENMYSRQLLEDAFKGLDILHLDEHDSVVDEGVGHSGMSALIDLVAKKPR